MGWEWRAPLAGCAALLLSACAPAPSASIGPAPASSPSSAVVTPLPAPAVYPPGPVPSFLRPGEEIVTLEVAPSVTVRYAVTRPASTAKGLFLLYPGGDARMTRGSGIYGPFRPDFVKLGYATAVVDIPSDAPPERTLGIPNQSRPFQDYLRGPRIPQAADKVLSSLSERFRPPFFLFGHSNGTTAAANIAATLNSDARVGALVLAAPQVPPGPVLTDVSLGRISVPVLIVRHTDDKCNQAEFADTYVPLFRGSPRVELLVLSGGAPPQAGMSTCQDSAHMFAGIQDEVTAAATRLAEGGPISR